ncbi:transporter substrate-binding domain-containing protein [Vibrio sp. T187]|uniref:substrate-binding periplasmic protein n=1 Tax=Vibrio TaxID=662 RepID=UPI0010C9D1D4|nr:MULTISPECIES: transporter substrate-binding domain-containing protein [Vibrio]MBW3698452.1 transporter substrate-binding domain-containing protein [Vibrio sp. T187]
MRVFLLLIVSSFFTGVGWGANVSVVIYGDSNYPPYSYKSEGELLGIYPDIVRSVAKGMLQFDIVLKAVPWNRGLVLLEHGEGSALFPPYYLPLERPYIDSYSRPLFSESVSVYCHESVVRQLQEPVEWPESFYGLRIGVNAGYHLGSSHFWKAVEDGHIRVQSAKSPEANILMLYSKRNDCYLHSALSVEWAAHQMLSKGAIPSLDWLVLVQNVDQNSGFIGYTIHDAVFPFKEKFIERFNQEFMKQEENGLIDKIVEPYLK